MCGHLAYEGTSLSPDQISVSPDQSLCPTSQPDTGLLRFYHTWALAKLHDRFCPSLFSSVAPLEHARSGDKQYGNRKKRPLSTCRHCCQSSWTGTGPRGGWGWWGRRAPLRDGGLGEQSEGVSEEGQGMAGKRRSSVCAGRHRSGLDPQQSWDHYVAAVENPSQRQEFHSTNIYGTYSVQTGPD